MLYIKKIGDGTQTKFWKDRWCKGEVLCENFPLIYALEVDKECFVVDRIKDNGPAWNWARRLRQGTVQQQMGVFLGFVGEAVCGLGPDRWYWDIEQDGIFSVAGTRKHIDNIVLEGNCIETRWCELVPRKVNIFIWRLLLGRLPTFVELVKRGVAILNTNCSICEWEEESLAHIFSRCEVAKKTWEVLFRWLDIQVGNFRDPSDLLNRVGELKMNCKKRQVVEVVIFTGLWYLWKYRNDVVHGAKKIKQNMIIDGIQEMSFLWCSSRQKKMLFSWGFWLQNPLLVL